MFDPFFGLLFLAAIIAPVIALIHWLKPRPRRSTHKGLVLVGCAITAPLAFVFYSGPVLLITSAGAVQMYVLAPEQKADHFTKDPAALSNRCGLTPHLAQMAGDGGSTLFSLDASGYRVNVWSMNQPLDGQENTDECGHYSDTHSDPGQYVLRVSRMWPLGTNKDIKDFVSHISADLKVMGYEVRAAAIACSPLSKVRAPH